MVRRFGRKVRYFVDSGDSHEHNVEGIQRVTFSKPDRIVLGGFGKQKFYGCVYNATIVIHWSGMPVTTLHLTRMFLARDALVSGVDLLVGVCVELDAECRSSNTEITLSNQNGSIASPLPVQQNSNISACVWTLGVPQGYRVKLQLRFLYVNDSSSCASSFVEILEGRGQDSSFIGRYCNRGLTASSREPIYSLGRHLTVSLWTNGSDSVEFAATYSMASLSEGPCPARADLTGKNGTFFSPHFPYSYGPNRACSWVITVPRDKHVLISFRPGDFSIAGCLGNCRCDFLETREIEDGGRNAYWRYCGSIAPAPIYYAGNKLALGFVSDSREDRKGFRATYQAIGSLVDKCSDHIVLTDTAGAIASPRFPLPYPGNMDCLWEVRGALGSRIHLTFNGPLYFDMDCTDYIELSDGKTGDTRTYVKKLCISDDTPLPFVSKGNRLFVRFRSDRYKVLDRERYGFSATYVITRPKQAKKVSGTMLLAGTPLMTSSFILLSILANET